MSGWGDAWGDIPWGGVRSQGFTPTATYRLVLAARSASGLGTPIISDVLAAGVEMDASYACRWSRNLNAAGSIEFTLPIDSAGVTEANFHAGRELHLYRDDGGGEVLVWAGHLYTPDVRAPWVRFLGLGFYEYFRHREVGEDFYKVNVEQRSIAWQLLAYAQSLTYGSIGVTRETAAGSSALRTVDYCAEARQNIAEAIEDLAGADDGFDFEVGPDKVWRTWTPLRGTDLSGTVTLDTTVGIVAMAYTADGTQVENEVAGIGKKGDCEPIHYVVVEDTPSQAIYGLMQGNVQRSDIRQDDNLISALARQRLALHKAPRKQPTVRLFQGLDGPSPLTEDFGLGDDITVDSSWGFATFADPFRVLGYAVSFDKLGYEFIDVTLDAVA